MVIAAVTSRFTGRARERLCPMSSRIMVIVCLVGSVMLLWAGCGGAECPADAPEASLVPAGGACAHDADCRSGFCDRDICVDRFGKWTYGSECDLELSVDGGQGWRPRHTCEMSVCVEGRCRSCVSDAECQSYLGTGKCIYSRARALTPRRICLTDRSYL